MVSNMKKKNSTLDTFGKGTNWNFWKPKGKAGVHSAGEYGGFYTRSENGKVVERALIKCEETNISANISEFIGSKIFGTIAPGYGAEVSLTTPQELQTLPPDGSGVYVRSSFFKDYANDMYVDMDKKMSNENAPSKRLRTAALKNEKGEVEALGRPYMMGSRKVLGKAFDELRYQGFDQVAPTSLLIGDFDMHAGNIGVIRQKDSDPKLVRIDFGGAFTRLSNNVHPHSHSRHIVGLGPTNHFREFPRKLKLNDQFVNGLFSAANKDLKPAIDKTFQELAQYYKPKVLGEWAKKAMPERFKDRKPEEINVTEITDSFKEVMGKRQQSLKEFGIEIKLGLLLEKKANGKVGFKDEKAEVEFKALVKDNEKYFEEIAHGKKKFKFRDKNLRGFITQSEPEKFIKAQIKNEIATRIKDKTLNLPKLELPTGDAIALSEQSIEREVERSGKGLKESGPTILPSTTSGKTAISPVIDPVSLVREEIINKQMQILKEAVAISYPDTVGLSMEQFKDYLKNHQDIVVKSLENPPFKQDIEAQIQQTEVAGYKKFNQEFAKVAKPVAWDGPSTTSGEKTQIVKNKEGQEVCTLKEITSSQTFTAPDGSTKQVSTRSIEFPPSLKEGSGPMHASFALKNAKGDNMPAKDAVYFTVHYDKTGKLMEVTSPQPIKFMGKEDNAIGYIERNGEIYTLPVTKKTYNEMMTEVTKNKGVGINLTVKEQISSGAELVSARVKPEPEVIPQVPLVEAMSKVQISETSTKEDAMTRIDKILKNRKPEEIVAMLKNEIKNGRDKIVDLVVQATSPARDGRPPEVPTLSKSHYLEAYTDGMKHFAPKAKNTIAQGNIHRASAKLLEHVQSISPMLHRSTLELKVKPSGRSHGRSY
ncbi:surface antigen protein [Candidatus Megaera polyxenophila]|nr:surface antigen protein [Candidatus Megaera polyxenophila]